MPPLQTPGIAYTSQKRCNKANAHGGAKISALRAGPCGPVVLRNAPAGAAPPYRAAETGSQPQTLRGPLPRAAQNLQKVQKTAARRGVWPLTGLL